MGAGGAGAGGSGAGGGSASSASSFFGSHFLMGGERYDVARPDTFLFGDLSDLELLCMTKPAKVNNYIQSLLFNL